MPGERSLGWSHFAEAVVAFGAGSMHMMSQFFSVTRSPDSILAGDDLLYRY